MNGRQLVVLIVSIFREKIGITCLIVVYVAYSETSSVGALCLPSPKYSWS